MLALVARVAPSMATVLLLGESGTGKELVARAVHEASTRAHRALVAVDCSSLPENLFESELFGHERGAFTGASAARGGLVEAASGGTLFLDEVGDIPLAMQVKLLRLLETGTHRRVGSTDQRHADIRVVSATHRDLDQMASAGTFPIYLPALRERKDDIMPAGSRLAGARGPSAQAAHQRARTALGAGAGLPGQCQGTAKPAGTRGAAVRRQYGRNWPYSAGPVVGKTPVGRAASPSAILRC